MISVVQALTIIQDNIEPTLEFKRMAISKSLGQYLFEDVISPINMPSFRQSAMDGYALHLNHSLRYRIIGEVKAGDSNHPILNEGEAVRIFTGAPVPNTSNAVIIQEHTSVEGQTLTINKPVSVNANIRPLGEQVTKGQIALKAGTLLTPAAIGFLTSLGISEVTIYKKPSIAIVVTGDELVAAGKKLAYGQIYESNAVMMATALYSLNFQNVTTYKVDDDYESTADLLKQVIKNHDIVLITGGISVGDYDFVGKALQELGVATLFHKVKQKPGKPLFFGKKGKKIVFALPGNPAAALSCFYIYVCKALHKMSGNMNYSLNRIHAKSLSDYVKKGDRSQFLKAIYHNGTVEILEGQSSSMLHTFALANALIFISEDRDGIKIKDMVEVILLPNN